MTNEHSVFVDSSFICSAKNKRDSNHVKAVTLFQELRHLKLKAYTGTHIILESATIISQQVGKPKSIEVIDELRSGAYTLIHPNVQLLAETESIFCSLPSKNVSYADCLSFAIMKKHHITWVFSFDIHFKKQGFKRIGIDGKPGS